MSKEKQKQLVNDEIHFDEILLIDENGSSLGKTSTEKAKQEAYSKNLDLVLMSQNGKLPVCKIMDYGKFKFEQAKKEKSNRKNSKSVVTKEIQISLRIDKHDLETKIKNARKFLEQGNNVLVVMRLRGRENSMPDYGKQVLVSFYEKCEDIAILNKPIAIQGNQITFVMSKR